MNIFKLINEDLAKVHALMEKKFKIKAGYLKEFVTLDFNYFDQSLRPAMVILSNRLFSPVTEKTIALAGVLQFIYMASQVHLKVQENNNGKEKYGDSRFKYQFPVLVGDYLYGRFFTTLCDAGIVNYLKKLAELICLINKGGILSPKYPSKELLDTQQYIDVIKKETAEMFACSAYLGADVAGAGEEDKQHLYNYGINVGMAYGLLERGASVKQIAYYIDSAEAAIKQFPPSREINLLKELLVFLAKENSIACNMVV
ncbi:polyprenyl synthetase family protein [Desulfotruncus alcoholivorax]|uniref:polyprenyl synthetase family protein n=1 Tax=Desulfotruncus alcoholivorax TaxID=265477 RepID=UPI0003FD0B75|nr:polyprenyl synthetase family protein [Desulfotruncus alcoholivorax]